MFDASLPIKNWKNPYKDGKILAIGIPLVTVAVTLIGTNNDFSNPESLVQLAMKLGYNTLVVALCWLIVRQLIIFMDKRASWEKGKEPRRLLQQIPLVFFGMSLVYFSATILRTYFFEFWPIDWAEIWLTDYPLAILFLLLINFLYFYLWQQGRQADASSPVNNQEEGVLLKIKVMKGRAVVLLDPNQISCAFRENEINYIIDAKGATYHWDDSLNALEILLPGFFRLNRQYLINRQTVRTFSVRSNRNLSVELSVQKGKRLEVNKNKAASFRQWLKEGLTT